MANPHLQVAFEVFGISDPGWYCKCTSIKIIEMSEEVKANYWMETDFWKFCKAEHINISFLEKPCVMNHVSTNNGNKSIEQIESKHLFEKHFWPKILEEPVAGAICISHLRALNSALAENKNNQLTIVLEGDVRTTENTIPLFCAFLANWYGNPEVKDCNYVALSWSDWHLGYAKKMTTATRVRSSRVGRYFELMKLPMNMNHNAYDFIGQGARALAFSNKFSEKVIDTKVGGYWDLHLLSLLAKEDTELKRQGWKNDVIALVASPVMFTHVPNMGCRFRGSGRLLSLTETPSEPISRYICLDLSKEWGLANRLQTMVLWTAFCSMTNLGMYVLWEPKTACPCKFYEIFNFNIEGVPTSRMPFLRVLDDHRHNQWKASITERSWCMGVICSQTLPEAGFQYWKETWKQIREKLKEPLKSFLEKRLSMVDEVEKQLDEYWLKFGVNEDIVQEAKLYCEENNFQNDVLHVGFHVRRTDFKRQNLREQIGKGHLTKTAEDDLATRWQDADEEFQARRLQRKRFNFCTKQVEGCLA